MPFDRILIANRAEIALRVMRTCRRLGISTVAVHSDPDAAAAHVRAADLAVRIGPAPAAQSYLRTDAVIDAALATGAQAIHPGYGFLSENADFAAACADAGIVFLGPSAHAIRTMGDKIAAKRTVSQAGVPVVPGIAEHGLDDAQLIAHAQEIGLPLLIKPSAGGGGTGMRAVHSADALPDALLSARREAAAAFGDDTLFLERFIETARHIEIQILADAHGHVVHLGERECSLQRRHQKVIEEAPSPLLDPGLRDRMGRAAAAAAHSVDYTGAGTVEFIVPADRPEEFSFMEMNTRLQVEHPVTEEVYGTDLVEWQFRIGAGEPLTLRQEELVPRRHAIECRIYAEDPARGFLPTGGTPLDVRLRGGPGLRVDSGVSPGVPISSDYDPMIAKLIAVADTRTAALRRMRTALTDAAVPGVVTNIDLLHELLGMPQVISGDLDTGLLDRLTVAGDLPRREPAEADWMLGASALLDQPAAGAGAGAGAWEQPSGWRSAQPAVRRVRLVHEGHERLIELGPEQLDVPSMRGIPDVPGMGDPPDPPDSQGRGEGTVRRVRSEGVTHAGRTWHGMVLDPRASRQTVEIWVRSERGIFRFSRAVADPVLHAGDAGADILAPMPGRVLALRAAHGEPVQAGQPVLILEAMKMEHVLTAPVAGALELRTRTGAQVTVDEVLATITDPQEDI